MNKGKTITKVGIYAATLFIVFLFLVPILIIILGSFRNPVHLFDCPPRIITEITLANFKYAFSERVNLQAYLLNSAIYAISSTLVALIIGLPTAYALARNRGIFNKSFIYSILLIRAIPPISLIVPLYYIFVKVRLTGTYYGLIIAYVGFHLPFIIWIMRGFFLDIKQDMIDAAYIDGCGRMSAFCRIALPLSVPGIMVVAIFCFIGSWNELLYALILTTKDTCSAPVFIASFYADTSVSYGMLYASSAITIVPLLVMTFFLQKYIVRGLSLGGIKE